MLANATRLVKWVRDVRHLHLQFRLLPDKRFQIHQFNLVYYRLIRHSHPIAIVNTGIDPRTTAADTGTHAIARTHAVATTPSVTRTPAFTVFFFFF